MIGKVYFEVVLLNEKKNILKGTIVSIYTHSKAGLIISVICGNTFRIFNVTKTK